MGRILATDGEILCEESPEREGGLLMGNILCWREDLGMGDSEM